MRKIIIIFIFSFILINNDGLYPAEIYKWVDEHGVLNFSDNFEKIPLKYRSQIKKSLWNEENDKTDENRIEEIESAKAESSAWRLEWSEKQQNTQYINENRQLKFTDLCSERNYHLNKAREKFPYERNITKAWLNYYKDYLTEDEKKRIPFYIKTGKDPCNRKSDTYEIKGNVIRTKVIRLR